MNVPLTRIGDGLPRRAFTNADLQRMVDAGVIDADEPIELIKGEIIPMPSEHDLHGRARAKLVRLFNRALSDDYFVSTELSLFLLADTEFKPDLHIFPAAMKSHDVRGRDVLLAVELSSSTQRKDLQVKAPIYAEGGVSELWVIDLDSHAGVIFIDPKDGVFQGRRELGADDEIAARAFPDVCLKIADLF